MSKRGATTRIALSSASDEELVGACLAGDDDAWRELIARYGGYVYAVITRAFSLAGGAADEVFQDVCVRVYEGLAGFAGRGEFRSWLRAVVLSAAREHLRREARKPRTGEAEEVPTEAVLEELEAALDLHAAVSALGDPCATTIRLYFFRGLTQSDVARVLGVPAGTVAARLSRCLRRLRDALQESGSPGTSRG